MGLISREQAILEAQLLFGTAPTTATRTEAKPKPERAGADSANNEETRWKARDARSAHATRLSNARGWVEHFGAQALMFHDAAARAAERRDRALALVAELETTNGGTAA